MCYVRFSYVCVLSVYMMTKSSVGVVGQHPVVSRLAQYRQLLQVKEVHGKLLPNKDEGRTLINTVE